MKLSYQSGTTYSKNDATITTPFDMDVLFGFVDAIDGIPKTKQVNAKLAELFNVKPSSYSKFSQMTESAEFHAACDAHGSQNAISMKKDARKESPSQQGPRGSNGGITNAVKQSIGEFVVREIEATFDIDAADYDITEEYIGGVVSTVFNNNEVELPRPELRVKTEKQLTESVKSQLTASVKLLAGSGMDAATIAAAIPNIDEDDVNTMLA